MRFFVRERKSAALACLILKLHVPRGVFGGIVIVAAQTFGSVTPVTGVMLTDAVGSGACGARTKFPDSHATASSVIEVTEMVLPLVHAGNLEGEMARVRTWSLFTSAVLLKTSQRCVPSVCMRSEERRVGKKCRSR